VGHTDRPVKDVSNFIYYSAQPSLLAEMPDVTIAESK
jgi:hypothetical protein